MDDDPNISTIAGIDALFSWHHHTVFQLTMIISKNYEEILLFDSFHRQSIISNLEFISNKVLKNTI